MTNQKPSQMLRKAWALIDAPEKWTQGISACNKEQQFRAPHDLDASCFCSFGAIIKSIDQKYSTIFQNSEIIKSQIDYLKKAMESRCVAEFNDTHTWEEVKSAWMKAIALAEEDETKNEQTI